MNSTLLRRAPDPSVLRGPLEALPAETRQRLEATLLDDMFTEFDARFLVAFVQGLTIDFSDEFRAVFAHWAEEEEAHFVAFGEVCGLFRSDLDEELADRRPDFSGLQHLFGSEFEILCLLAYDELSTIRGYRGNLPLYDLLGPEFASFLRGVVADEGAHYAAFRQILRRRHQASLPEAPRVIRRIRNAEGTPYRATFVLDHDDPIYGEAIFDEAAQILEHQLADDRKTP